MNLIQYTTSGGKRAVGAIDGGKAFMVKNASSVYALALKAAACLLYTSDAADE